MDKAGVKVKIKKCQNRYVGWLFKGKSCKG